MTTRKRSDTGEYDSDITETDILGVVRQNEPAGTQEVADELGLSRQGADYRLRRLSEVGKVLSKKVGGTLVWSVEDDS
ncbi:winged helix-turn-helix transcriptional regulator [Halorussus ruber]|uniref:winged helix-turn-helix transcriptional regulator n=1 Tax=Halorussus ruber TaxID=1126238 RepID=UPI001091FB37|nr:winged helix-turn-helix transcriptional regulator [Halorussus ruber]